METKSQFANLPAFSGTSTSVTGAVAALPFVALDVFGKAVSEDQMLAGIESRVREHSFLGEIRGSDVQEKYARLVSLEQQLLTLLGDLERRQKQAEEQKSLLEKRAAELEAQKKSQEEQAQILTQAEAQLKLLGEVAAQMEGLKKAYWTENFEEIVGFSLDLVEKIIGDRVLADPALLVKHLRAVLTEIKIAGSIHIHLNPLDYNILSERATGALKDLLERQEIRFVTDLRLKSGEVVIDTSQYRLDASLTTAIRNIRGDLLESLGKLPVMPSADGNKTEGEQGQP